MFEKILQYKRDYKNKIITDLVKKKVYVRARNLFKFFLTRILMKRNCIFKNIMKG